MAELVPGDIVYLSAGDMVPADVRVIAAKDLFISQSALTGEAIPVEKLDRASAPADARRAHGAPDDLLHGHERRERHRDVRGRGHRRSHAVWRDGQGPGWASA